MDALSRAGSALGLEGWIVVSECSGVLLDVNPIRPARKAARPDGRPGYLEPAVGQVYSRRAAGLNPVSLALDQAAVALLPPGEQAALRPRLLESVPRAITRGLGIPLGDSNLPLGGLAILVPDSAQEACHVVFGQALFSAKAINLALALRQELQTNLEVVAGMAHEVKNPLTAVKGFLELSLAERTEVPEYSAVALRELDRAISLLEDYCLFSRAPRIVPTQSLAADGLLAETALLARGLVASGPAVSIVSRGSDPGLAIKADPPRIRQVFLNLCRNAVEAMPGGGVLTLGAAADNGDVVFEVADTGVGIPPGDAGRVFEAFYTTKPTGTGLGLPVCRRIVEAHGGRMTFESRPGQGTAFQVRIPRLKAGYGDPASSASSSSGVS